MITSPYYHLIIGISLSEINREMSIIRNVFSIAVPVVLILGAIAAWWLSGTALQPIRKVTTIIRRVTVKGLNQRIPMGTTDGSSN